MEKIWKAEQLEKIAANKSIFKHIPTEIGNVLYCDTNQPETVKLSDKETKKIMIIAISICSIILILYWSFLYEHYIWGAIITVISLLVTIRVCDTSFSGTDYFVGNKGFATVSFVDSRDNITSSNIYLFKDIEYFFTSETIVKTNCTYSNTEYYFSIFGKEDHETHQFNRIFFIDGSYSDKNPKDPMNPDCANEEYCMMKMVEKVWTTHFVLEHSQDEKVDFGILNEETLCSNALSISRNEIDVLGTIYNPSNTKSIYTSNGNLVIEHINHSKKFFGLAEKGNINSIPLSSLGNRQAFLIFFDRLYNR